MMPACPPPAPNPFRTPPRPLPVSPMPVLWLNRHPGEGRDLWPWRDTASGPGLRRGDGMFSKHGLN